MSEIRGLRELPEEYHEVHDDTRVGGELVDKPYSAADVIEAISGFKVPDNVRPYVTAGVATGVALFAIGALFGSRRARSAMSNAGSSVASLGSRAYHSVVGDEEDEAPRRRRPASRSTSSRSGGTRKASTASRAKKSTSGTARKSANGTTKRASTRRKAADDAELLH